MGLEFYNIVVFSCSQLTKTLKNQYLSLFKLCLIAFNCAPIHPYIHPQNNAKEPEHYCSGFSSAIYDYERRCAAPGQPVLIAVRSHVILSESFNDQVDVIDVTTKHGKKIGAERRDRDDN